MQLAGKPCGVCGQPITGRSEGAFCDRCGVPLHHHCRETPPAGDRSRCGECGSPADVVHAWQVRHERSALKATQADGVSLFRHGWGMVLAGVAYSLFAPFICCIGQPQSG